MIKEIKKEEFNNLVKVFPNATFYQTSNWATLKAFTGWNSLYLGYYENNILIAIGLFLIKKMPVIDAYLAYSPRGYLINYYDEDDLKNFNNELIEYLKNKKVFQLIIDPYLPLNQRDINGNIIDNSFDNHSVVNNLINLGYKHTGFNLYYENLHPRWLFRLPLKNKTYQDIEKGFKKEAKRRANKKDLFAINVRELRKEEISTFKELMDSTAKRKGFIDRPISYYKQMYDALNKDKILRYMVAEIDILKCKDNINNELDKENIKLDKLYLHPENNEGKIKEQRITIASYQNILKQLDILNKDNRNVVPLSVVCLLTYSKEAIMLLAGNNEDYLQHFNSSNIIVSQLIKLAINEGYDYYNFYGITGNFDPNSKDYGLYSYKKQYGGEVLELIGQFEYTINKPIKKLYDSLLKIYKLTK